MMCYPPGNLTYLTSLKGNLSVPSSAEAKVLVFVWDMGSFFLEGIQSSYVPVM